MLTKEEALVIAERFLGGRFKYWPGPITIVMQPDLSVEYPLVWVIAFDTQEHLDTGDRTKAPLVTVVIVPKDGSDPEFPPTAIPLEEYIEQIEAKMSKPPEE